MRKKDKSRYAKGWETRRMRQQGVPANEPESFTDPTHLGGAGQLAMPGDPTAISEAIARSMGPQLTAEEANPYNSPRTKMPAPGGNAEASSGDSILRTLVIHRNEQLCCFLGDMLAWRTMSRGNPGFMPMVVSRSQAEAIEDYLQEKGFSPYKYPRTA